MSLSRTVSEIISDFSGKSQNFPTPVYFARLLKGFPLELGTGTGIRKLCVFFGTMPFSMTLSDSKQSFEQP